MIRTWLVTSIVEYLAADARPTFIDQLSPAGRRLFEASRTDRESWTPIRVFIEALVAADRVCGQGNLLKCWDIGCFTAKHEAGAVRAFALRFLRPSAVMSLAASLWGIHYRDAGRVTTRLAGPRGVDASMLDFPTPHRAHCFAVGGWIQGALELGPRRRVEVKKTACRCEGALSCDYRVSWEER